MNSIMKTIQNFNWDIETLDNKQLQNIAFAHWVENNQGVLLYKKAFWIYPIEYSVNDDQIKEAKEELQKRKNIELQQYKNKLVFINMGMSFKNETKIINKFEAMPEIFAPILFNILQSCWMYGSQAAL